MSRTHLRLVEPIQEGQSFPEFNATGKSTEISQPEKVAAALQLFLLWPDYSSCLVRSPNGKTTAAKMSIDPDLKEVEDLLLTVDQQVHSALKAAATRDLEIIFEVFGLTYSFKAPIKEIAEDYSPGSPSVSVSVPNKLVHLSLRSNRRRKLSSPLAATLKQPDEKAGYACLLTEVSPTAMLFSFESANIQWPDLVSVECNGFSFKAIMKVSRPGEIVVGPITESPEDFGPYFDLYVSVVYPMLRNRHSFAEDPIPELALKTGQVEKFAAREMSDEWKQGVMDAYLASKDAQHRFTVDYVAIAENGDPVATSSLTYAFEDSDGQSIWAFHSVGAIADPQYLSHTAAVYMWRSDYLMSRDSNVRCVVWFDGKGKWIEKVYVKYQALTEAETAIWNVAMRRYIRSPNHHPSEETLCANWRSSQIGFKSFQRKISTRKRQASGFGVPYLNLAGGLDQIFSLSPEPLDDEDRKASQSLISKEAPRRFFLSSPSNQAGLEFQGYESYVLETVSRQVVTSSRGLAYFASSLEHSQAVTRRKYGSR